MYYRMICRRVKEIYVFTALFVRTHGTHVLFFSRRFFDDGVNAAITNKSINHEDRLLYPSTINKNTYLRFAWSFRMFRCSGSSIAKVVFIAFGLRGPNMFKAIIIIFKRPMDGVCVWALRVSTNSIVRCLYNTHQ